MTLFSAVGAGRESTSFRAPSTFTRAVESRSSRERPRDRAADTPKASVTSGAKPWTKVKSSCHSAARWSSRSRMDCSSCPAFRRASSAVVHFSRKALAFSRMSSGN